MSNKVILLLVIHVDGLCMGSSLWGKLFFLVGWGQFLIDAIMVLYNFLALFRCFQAVISFSFKLWACDVAEWPKRVDFLFDD